MKPQKARRHGAGRLSPRALAVAAKRAEAVRLRAAGVTFQSIAESLAVTTGRAHQLVDEALRATVAEPAEALRALQQLRLDAALRACFPRACTGGARALRSALD